jgi:hypothetical protein
LGFHYPPTALKVDIMISRFEPGKNIAIVTSQGHCDIAMFDHTTKELAATITSVLGFEVVENIKMSNGSNPAVVKKESLLKEAKVAEKSL